MALSTLWITRFLKNVHRINSDKLHLIRLNARYTESRVLPAMLEHMSVIEALREKDWEVAAQALDRHIRISESRALGADTIII